MNTSDTDVREVGLLDEVADTLPRHRLRPDRHRVSRGADTDEPPSRRFSPAARTRVAMLGALFIGALALRWFEIRRSYDIFLDEVTYAQLGHNLASGQGVTLYGAPFDLHPPTEFAIFAGVIRVFGLNDLPIDKLILDLRPVVAVFGAGTAVIAAVIARRCTNNMATLTSGVVGAAVAIDPFLISFDSRVMLEAIAQFCCAACIGFLVMLVANEHLPASHRSALIVASGIAAGVTFTSKETFGLVLAGTLLMLILLPGLIRRRDAATVVGIGSVAYIVVESLVWRSTGFAPWWHAQTGGLRRLVGTYQNTGFNAANTKVSLTSRLVGNVGLFAGSYLVLVLGGLAVLVWIIRVRPWRGQYVDASQRSRTVIAIWGLAAGGYLVYATLIGSLEEQMYYIPLLPLLILLVVTIGASRPRRSAGSWLVGALLVLTLCFNTFVWYRVHSRDNDSYEDLVSWANVHLTANARVAATDTPSQFLLRGVVIGKWTTLRAIEANGADYVVVDSTLVEQGYSQMSVATFKYIESHAKIAFQSYSDADGTLYVFDVRQLAP